MGSISIIIIVVFLLCSNQLEMFILEVKCILIFFNQLLIIDDAVGNKSTNRE